eukprot:g15643.t1
MKPRSGKRGLSRADEEAKAKSKSYSRYVRSFSRSKEETKAALRTTFNMYADMDEKNVAARGLPLLNPEVKRGHNGPLGAKTALENLLSCVDKGCCQDPMDLDEMYFNLGKGSKTGLMTWSAKGGTGINEAWHRILNQLVSSVQRIGWRLCDQRLLQFVHRYNLERDRKLGRLSKQSTLKVWLERDANKEAEGHLLALPWPRASPPPDVSDADLRREKLGFEYAQGLESDGLEDCRRAAMIIAGGVAEGAAGGGGLQANASQPPPPRLQSTPRLPPLQIPDEEGTGEGGGAAGGDGSDAAAVDVAGVGVAGTNGAAPALPEGGTAGAAPLNLGGHRVRHAKTLSVEGLQCVTPRTEAEVSRWSASVAKSLRQGGSRMAVLERAVDDYNTQVFTAVYSAGRT